MRYIAISEEDITTLKAAEIQQKRYAKAGIESEVCALVPLDKWDQYLKEERTTPIPKLNSSALC